VYGDGKSATPPERGESSRGASRYQGHYGVSPPEGKTLHLWGAQRVAKGVRRPTYLVHLTHRRVRREWVPERSRW
jgi:hypothetical protein